MADDRWARTERLFLDALEVPASDRATFLASACDDADLCNDVAALLDAHDAEGPFSERLHVTSILGDALASGDADLSPGNRVGPYQIVREIGRGGMGAVSLAERADGAFRQSVALKHVLGSETDLLRGHVRARFLRERDLLAGLSHPSIARLLGGGDTDDGAPYFAMEYVPGAPITEYCDRHQLSVADRIALFLDVCEAVAYAHRRLIVHRDLKPSNVLVTEGDDGPAVKLLDFGVAKLLDVAESDERTRLTTEAVRPYTPEYAAPEQVRGDAVGTAADVWALGVLLARLLGDRRPFAVRDRRPDALLLSITGAPVLPSEAASRPGAEGEPSVLAVAQARATTPDRLRRHLEGDLDAVVARCLRPEPEARYPSVDALAADLRRHLNGEPVEARRGTRWYVAARFVRRHRGSVTAALATLVALAAFTTALAVENRRTARERARAEATVGFLQEVLAGANALQTGRGDVTVAEMLDEAAGRVPVSFASQPDVQASLLLTIGEAYAGLSKYREAAPLLRRALALQRTVSPGDHPDTARLLSTLGLVVAESGALDSAATLQRESLAMTRRLFGDRALLTARVMNSLAWVEIQQTHWDEAERLLLGAIDVTGGTTPDSAAVLDAARARSSLSVLRMRTGDYAGAERLESEALGLREAQLGRHHPLVALSLSNLAKVIEDAGGPLDRALPYAERALTLRREISGDSSIAVLTSRSNLSAILRGLGRTDEAIAHARTATETADALFGDRHTATAYARYNLALALHAAGDRRTAAREYAQALASHEVIWGIDHPYTAYVLVPYAKLALEQGDARTAERRVRPAVRARRAADPASWLTADAEATLGRALLATGRRSDALPLLKRALRVLRQQRGDEACATRQAAAALRAARDGASRHTVPTCV